MKVGTITKSMMSNTEKYFPDTICQDVTGLVLRISNVPVLNSSERERIVIAGIRNNNDLIWIGRAPSLAAKLSDLREYPHCTFISAAAYNRLSNGSKFSGGKNMWEQRSVNFAGANETIYRSSYWWKPG